MKNQDKIRKRVSYKFFKELAEWLKTKPDKIQILKRVNKIIDDYKGFHSQYNSKCALESIELIEKKG